MGRGAPIYLKMLIFQLGTKLAPCQAGHRPRFRVYGWKIRIEEIKGLGFSAVRCMGLRGLDLRVGLGSVELSCE